jgi:chlorite dismutase
VEKGDSALYSMLTQKGDLLFVHYRESPEALNQVELSLRGIRLFDYLKPSYSYFSVIEIGLYELTGLAHRKLAEEGLTPGKPEFEAAFAKEMEGQRERIKTRLFRDIPEGRYICFYPMNKKRGEAVNWYTLSMEERRQMMRGHGRIGHKYHETVTQIIGGSVGLDDWEWGVSLHADDCLVFKKLIYEMRFDPASAIYAEFGPFYVGIRRTPEQLADLLAGRVDTDS